MEDQNSILKQLAELKKTHGNATISPLLALAEGLKMHLQEHLNFDHQEFL